MKFKPMLAATIEDINTLQYPVYASPKLDGIRSMMQDGQMVSRNLKPIANAKLQAALKDLPEGIDGEFIYGNPTAEDAFRQTTHKVMSRSQNAEGVVFHAFDVCSHDLFLDRYSLLQKFVRLASKTMPVVLVTQTKINNPAELLDYEGEMLAHGYEGVVVRSINGPYKEGRSTLSQGYLLKLKRFLDSEAEILSVVELQRNGNEATINALGRTERSSHQENMIPGGTMGKFNVRDLKTGVEFEVGSGFDDATRADFWKHRTKMAGKIIKYKYFPVGVKDKPRFPIFLGMRDKRDM